MGPGMSWYVKPTLDVEIFKLDGEFLDSWTQPTSLPTSGTARVTSAARATSKRLNWCGGAF